MIRNKEKYYKKYFESNWNNAKIIWKGIKSIITLKKITSSVPRKVSQVSQGKNLITNPQDIANIFSNYFSSVADSAKENIKYSHKHFSDYLNNQCNNSLFIYDTDSEEIANITSTLNMNKSSCPNSIPYKILNHLKEIFQNNFQIYLIFLFYQVSSHQYLK